jgi:putative transposase
MKRISQATPIILSDKERQGHRQVERCLGWRKPVCWGICPECHLFEIRFMPAIATPARSSATWVWLYFRFPLSLRMVEEMLAARGLSITYETIRQWGLKFGQAFANRIRQRAPRRGDKWHLDEVVLTIAGKKHGLWRAVDGTVQRSGGS